MYTIFLFDSYFEANSGDHDQMQDSAASDLSLQCLPIPHKMDARLTWVENCSVYFV